MHNSFLSSSFSELILKPGNLLPPPRPFLINTYSIANGFTLYMEDGRHVSLGESLFVKKPLRIMPRRFVDDFSVVCLCLTGKTLTFVDGPVITAILAINQVKTFTFSQIKSKLLYTSKF